MTPRAHRTKWTLCIADEAKSRQAMTFQIGSLEQQKAEAQRDARIRAGQRCYVLPPVEAWSGKY
jgi:hypothetical protein